jgi:hypothetical protein
MIRERTTVDAEHWYISTTSHLGSRSLIQSDLRQEIFIASKVIIEMTCFFMKM